MATGSVGTQFGTFALFDAVYEDVPPVENELTDDGAITLGVSVTGFIPAESIPLPGVDVAGEIVLPLQGGFSLPGIDVSGAIVAGGALAAGDLRLPRVDVTGFLASDQATIPLPGVQVAGELLTGSLATSGLLSLPAVDVSGLIVPSGVLVGGTIGVRLGVTGEILAGSVSEASPRLPAVTVLGEILGGSVGGGLVALPGVRVAAEGYAVASIESGDIRIALAVTGTIFGPAVGAAAATGAALSLNTATLALTRYAGLAFNSFARAGDRVLAAGADGIHLLQGGDDAGNAIEASFTTGHIDFGAKHEARLVALFVSYRTEGAMRITVRADDLASHTYLLDRSRGAGVYRNRVKFGRGFKARYYQLTFENTDGADFSIDRIEPETQRAARRLA